jgi:threonine synthase
VSLSFLSHLECSRTGQRYDPAEIQHLSKVGAPLLAHYDIDRAREAFTPDSIKTRPFDLWRYREVLPVRDAAFIVSLGEGGTPLVHARRLGHELGLERLLIKDESLNPTASFKARGMTVAVSMALALGARELATPSAGNAGAALAAYAASAGVPAHVVLPRDAPRATALEAEALGANVGYVDGLIGDAGRVVAERCQQQGWYDLSTLKEPYRIEGKKTMGYELYEQLGGRLPEVILYPTGGGTGLIGMWKAFEEMEALGWTDSRRPRMVSVQSTGCAPIALAMDAGADECAFWENAHTIAPGVRVPKALGDFLILRALRESSGRAVAVSDEALVRGARKLSQTTGVLACPEAGACFAALEILVRESWLREGETVVLFNTASGAKYFS